MAMNSIRSNAEARARIADALTQAKRTAGLTQQGLAEALGTSQATISKLLRGDQDARPALAARIDALIARQDNPDRRFGLDEVIEAYGRSRKFRRLCVAVLALMDENE